jgi:hypothetical protein
MDDSKCRGHGLKDKRKDDKVEEEQNHKVGETRDTVVAEGGDCFLLK